MDETEFWEIVDGARQEAEGDPEEQADLVVERLLELDPEGVVDFARHFETRLARALRWDVWGAAEVMLGGADEESFDAFRCWLIGQGRHVFEGALHQGPDRLAELVERFDPRTDGDAEDLGYAADEAYEQLTGVRLPDLGVAAPAAPQGEPLDLSDETALAARLPRLWERFGRRDG
ncbi:MULTISPECIES: DUF4240 domain-containing protein [Streptomycetaceae]|uniref:DUF4240 domain-containing protein n=1 Tax=Streptantibioticus cattleyicolor (strain ATCC 35852 / DSM 46488 / JCM 4925 / NBRC 14057 / NRRL 8057) TaxID=1003195 RepID=F8K1Y5_STREN|nr:MULTISPECIES: DUF4240 domain-containing protein [Streptomycetaceae]AEW93677.1 hypothetical protein SCATT_13060 [Streptantibioticus cattleyicolor NRRL 8057 = DSM 46488]MYS58378.1 DUF4240 domain-containing protein [Streptomyces sp. SID5468]CCB74027.1 conserved protein of unknown function [Streptantibioticus cattleyicolor NRRL 8057 = DSM 46488]